MFVAIVGAVVVAQSTSPLIGTWKLNVAKSKASFKSGTSVIEAAGDGIKFTVDLVGADGAKSHWGFTANYDGKDVPVTGDSIKLGAFVQVRAAGVVLEARQRPRNAWI